MKWSKQLIHRLDFENGSIVILVFGCQPFHFCWLENKSWLFISLDRVQIANILPIIVFAYNHQWVVLFIYVFIFQLEVVNKCLEPYYDAWDKFIESWLIIKIKDPSCVFKWRLQVCYTPRQKGNKLKKHPIKNENLIIVILIIEALSQLSSISFVSSFLPIPTPNRNVCHGWAGK